MGWKAYPIRGCYGRIVWYSYWSWDLWYKLRPDWIPVAQKPSKIFNKIFTHRFRGNNRGRHFDRKRRD